MTDRDIDCRCAEIMGIRLRTSPPLPSPTTNANDDDAVLEWVRENWSLELQQRFAYEVYGLALERYQEDDDLQGLRNVDICVLCRKRGDYAHALVAVEDGE